MRILGLSAVRPYSAAIAVDNCKVVGGSLESAYSGIAGDSSFPALSISALQNYNKPFDAVALPHRRNKARIVEQLQSLGISCPIYSVDNRDALARSAIVVNRLQSLGAAILVVDDLETSIGYYVNNEIYWHTQLHYPNSLCLFYSAATRFLGYKPVFEETKVEQLSLSGDPIFCDVIKERVLELTDKGYNIKTNLERGLGVAGENSDVAASVQHIFNSAILNLAQYSKSLFNLDNLIFVGRASENALAVKALASSNLYDNVFLGTDCASASAALGAVACYTDVYWKSQYIGANRETLAFPDSVADSLLRGNIVDYCYGKDAYSDKALGSNSKISIPFKQLFDSLDAPIALVLEEDYSNYFSGNCGQFANTPVTIKGGNLPYSGEIRCIRINASSNPNLARIITLTRAKGFPILVFSDIS